jgi:hypothetical protein
MRHAVAWLWIATVIALAGCAAPTPAPLLDAAAAPPAGPVTPGLALRWWIVDDPPNVLAALGDTYGDLHGFLRPEQEDNLRRHGLRMIRLPVERLPDFHDSLSITRTLSTDWVGSVSQWVRIMRGPWLPEGQRTAHDGSELTLPAGRFELLIRAWPVASGGPPNMQVECTLGYVARRRTARIAGTGEWSVPSLRARLRLEPGYVYILTQESPSIEWEPVATPPALADPTPGDGGGPEFGEIVRAEEAMARDLSEALAESSQPEGDFLGPPAPVAPAMGELLFKSPSAAWYPGQGQRAMVAIYPELPRHLTLLPPLPRAPAE